MIVACHSSTSSGRSSTNCTARFWTPFRSSVSGASRFGRDTLAPLWSPHELITIAIGNTFLTGYYRQINYLTRLNSTDDIWQGAGPQRWFTQFATRSRATCQTCSRASSSTATGPP